MRRLIILGLLYGGMSLLLPLGAPGQGSWVLLAFGFLILAAYSVGELASVLRLPKIVGYLVAGMVFGPHVLHVVDEAGTELLAPVSELAIALIAFLAGAELRWSEVRERGVVLLKITVTELALTFSARTYLLQSEGLELGTARDGSQAPRVLISSGLTWRFF